MRKFFRRLMPDRDALAEHRSLRLFGNTLLHPRLWHLNRHSAAGAVAAGLFCGLIPGPFQMLGAALCAVLFRINLPLALVCTLYTNPLTIVPLYVGAFEIGNLLLGNGQTRFMPPPDFSWGDLSAGLSAWAHWAIGLGQPLAVGLLGLASALAVAGYVGVKMAWRLWLLRTWHARRKRVLRD